MPTSEQVLALLSSYASNDENRFASVAMQIAAVEAGKGRKNLADEIKRLVDESRRTRESPATRGSIHLATPQGELASLFTITQSDARLSDMVLEKDLRARLDRVLLEQRHLEKLRNNSLHPRRKLLLMGPPGSGKTMAATVLAGELHLPLCVVRLESLVTKFMGETTAKLRMVFDAVEKTRAVYLFDEFDSLGYQRSSGQDVGEMRRVLNAFLVFLESVRGQSIIISATNHGSMLDDALFRRFDDVLEFRMRLSLINLPQKTLQSIARESEGLSYGEIVRVCDDATKEMLLSGRKSMGISDLRKSLKERQPAIRRTKVT